MHEPDRRHSRGRWPDPFFAAGVLAIGLNLMIGNRWNPISVVLATVWMAGLFTARFAFRHRHNVARTLLTFGGYAAVYAALLILDVSFHEVTPFIFFLPILCAYAVPEPLETVVVGGSLIALCVTYGPEIGYGQTFNYSFCVASVSIVWTMIFRLVLNVETDRDRYYRLSITDSMTGLLTLAKTLELGQAMLSRGEAVGLAMIDLDGFKRINDTYGHLVGNRILTEFSQRLSLAAEQICPECVVGRLGGDEFVVVFATAAATDACPSLVKALVGETYRPVPEAQPLTLPFSLGFAAVPAGSPRSIEELMHEADLGMYAEKRQEVSLQRAETAATSRLVN